MKSYHSASSAFLSTVGGLARVSRRGICAKLGLALFISLSCLPIVAQSSANRLWTGLHNSTVASVAISSSGSLLASASYDYTVKLWRNSDGLLLRTLSGHTAEVRAVTLSPDGTLVASGSADRTVKIWRTSDGALLRTLVGHSDVVRTLAFSPDGSSLVSGGQDKSVLLWRVSDGALLRSFAGNANWVLTLAFSPDGGSIVSGGADLCLTKWRVSDGAMVWRFTAHADWVMSLDVSPDGTTIATASADMTVKLWRMVDGSLVRTISSFGDAVSCVTFSPDGASILTADWTRTFARWRVADGLLLSSWLEVALINSVRFSPDGTSFGYGLSDGTVALASASGGGGGAVPALSAVVTTLKASYVNRDKVTILVSVTDGSTAVSGASVSVVVTSSKGVRTTLSSSTAANGVATLYYSVNSTKQGTGTYRVDATVSKSGYSSATDSTSFLVTK